MKALTIYQPYATLLVRCDKAGRTLKQYETRSWQTRYRGQTAIHAGRRHPAAILDNLPGEAARQMRRLLAGFLLENLPTGCVAGIGTLVTCHLTDKDFLDRLDHEQLTLGDYTPGRYAWEFNPIYELPSPAPAKGQMGLWDWADGQYEDRKKG